MTRTQPPLHSMQEHWHVHYTARMRKGVLKWSVLSVCLSVSTKTAKSWHSGITSTGPVLNCNELSKNALLCSQVLWVARKLYKSLAVVDHAYRLNLPLQSSHYCACSNYASNSKMQYLKTSVSKVCGVCALRVLVLLCSLALGYVYLFIHSHL